MTDHFTKGVTPAAKELDGSSLRILIIHTRWNYPIVQGLVKGVYDTLTKLKVQPNNIVTHSVPGAYELPFAAQRLIYASQQQAAMDANELIDSGADLLSDNPAPVSTIKEPNVQTRAFDAVIPIGVLIKGSTMHFEYICDAVSQGLMRVGLDTGVPVIFGVLTCLTDEQALERAGMSGKSKNEGHNHGIDWASAAVEMAALKNMKL